jgi:hypothetical protein
MRYEQPPGWEMSLEKAVALVAGASGISGVPSHLIFSEPLQAWGKKGRLGLQPNQGRWLAGSLYVV